MNVVGLALVGDFATKHPESRTGLNSWVRITSAAQWSSIADVRKVYPHADAVDRCTVFNISGNKYRLACRIDYAAETIRITSVMTHAQYSKDKWKKDCQKT